MSDDTIWAPRQCFLDPIPEIFEAAALLSQAVECHLADDRNQAEKLIIAADMPCLSTWVETLWGKYNPRIHRYRPVDNLPPLISAEDKIKQRMPDAPTRRELIARDGYHCRYCGIPVIRQEIRNHLRNFYPASLRWGKGNKNQHAAFQCLWLTYEHILPHARGGDNSAENMIISCQACNCAKMNYTLEEVGLIDPRNRPVHRTEWDGLERFG